MRRMAIVFTLLLSGLMAPPASADTLVLIHGYRENPSVWYLSGIVQQLTHIGYRDSGPVRLFPAGLRGPGLRPTQGPTLFTVELPDTAPIGVQATVLAESLRQLRLFTDARPYTLIGHSAGGLAARMALVQHPELNVSRLVTIGTPHFGASLARLAAMVSDSPMGTVADFMGMDDFSDASDLFKDLRPISQNRFLQWLNSRPHPPAAYISLLRPDDDIVPLRSQDMNFIPSIGGRAIALPTPGGHDLNPRDGAILAALLNSHQ